MENRLNTTLLRSRGCIYSFSSICYLESVLSQPVGPVSRRPPSRARVSTIAPAELKAMSQDHDALLQVTDSGLYCERGGFYIDPWKPVGRAVVTHAHSDHLAWGCGEYLVARDGLAV